MFVLRGIGEVLGLSVGIYLVWLFIAFLGAGVISMGNHRDGADFFRGMARLPPLVVGVVGSFSFAVVTDAGLGAYELAIARRRPSFSLTRALWRWWSPRDMSRSSKPHLQDLRTLEQLLAITPTDFERVVADVLAAQGFRKVVRSGGPGDLGADLRGHDASGQSMIAQCKQYAPPAKVGSRDLQQFIGMAVTHHRAQRRLFFTTSTFTKAAIDLARRHSVELWDGARICDTLRALSRDGAVTTPSRKPQARTGLIALAEAEAKLGRREAQDERRGRYRYENAFAPNFNLTTKQMDDIRTVAARRALLMLDPDAEPSDEEIGAVVARRVTAKAPKWCANCPYQMPWYPSLPGHFCKHCGRGEIWIGDEKIVLVPAKSPWGKMFAAT
jgi:hypothetical protein